jgi:hypothetical protein
MIELYYLLYLSRPIRDHIRAAGVANTSVYNAIGTVNLCGRGRGNTRSLGWVRRPDGYAKAATPVTSAQV